MGLCASVEKSTSEEGTKSEGWSGKVDDDRVLGGLNDDDDDKIDSKSASFSQARDSMIYNKKQLEKAQLHKDHGDQPTEIDLGAKHKKAAAGGAAGDDDQQGVAEEEGGGDESRKTSEKNKEEETQ